MSWGPLQILLVLVIVVLLFGTKKLRNLGSDLGSSIKSFKKSMGDSDKDAATADRQQTLADDENESAGSGQQTRADKDDVR